MPPRPARALLLLTSLSVALSGAGLAAAQRTPTTEREAASDREARPSKLRPARRARRVDVSMQDATLPELVRFVARVTGRRFILTGDTADVRVTVVSERPATPTEVWHLFVDALAMQGVAVLRSGLYYRVVPTEGIAGRSTPVVTDSAAGPPTDAFGIHLFRVRDGSVEDAAALLAHFSSPEGHITAHPPTRTLIVSDTGANVRRMIALLRELRTRPTPDRIWVQPLENADSEALSEALRQIEGVR